MSDPKLNPGSNAAIQAGCTCARVDNHYGMGFIVNGERCFIKSGDCPLHGEPSQRRDRPDAMQYRGG